MSIENPTKKELEELRDLKYSRAAIAAKYGVSLAQVKRWLTDHDITNRGRKKVTIDSARVNRGVSLPTNYGITLVEQAQTLLGSRMVHDKHHGYKVDGRPMKVTDIVKMLGLKNTG